MHRHRGSANDFFRHAAEERAFLFHLVMAEAMGGDEVHCRPRSASGNPAAIYFCGGMKMSSENQGTPEVLTIAPEEFQLMQSAVLDGDGGEALRLLKKFVIGVCT